MSRDTPADAARVARSSDGGHVHVHPHGQRRRCEGLWTPQRFHKLRVLRMPFAGEGRSFTRTSRVHRRVDRSINRRVAVCVAASQWEGGRASGGGIPADAATLCGAAQELLQQPGCAVNGVNEDGFTPLHVALTYGQVQHHPATASPRFTRRPRACHPRLGGIGETALLCAHGVLLHIPLRRRRCELCVAWHQRMSSAFQTRLPTWRLRLTRGLNIYNTPRRGATAA